MSGGLAAWLDRLWYPEPGRGISPPMALRAASAVYGLAARARGRAYDRGLLRAHRLPVSCVSVGNLSVGGTGKTPLAAWLIEELSALGARPGVVSRGYGGGERGPARVPASGDCAVARRFGDEPTLLAARYPGVPVVVGRDRVAAGRLAAAEGADVVVADDGFQHRRLARDLDLAVLDAARGLGNERLLPAGPLREAPAVLSRAGAIVLNRAAAASDLDGLRRTIAGLAPRARIVEADLAFAGWRDARSGRPAELPAAAGVYAFSGIANPGSFRRTLEEQRLRVAGWEVFRDHHAYRPGDMERIARSAASSGAVAAVTTAKDAVRVPSWESALPLYRAEVKLVMISGRETLWEMLRSIMPAGRG